MSMPGHRVCMLGRKIEALQAQVYGLELRNRECYEAMARWEAERKAGAAEIQRLRAENRRLAEEAAVAAEGERRGLVVVEGADGGGVDALRPADGEEGRAAADEGEGRRRMLLHLV